MTRDDLIRFEKEIADEFNAGNIRFPIHLSAGNEDQLIEIFRDVRETDWIFGSWRFHYHCLLKGVPPEELRQAIRDGHSIALSFPEHRVYCSAIVGGIVPIALGVAAGVAKKGERVWCFLGDMTAETGIVHECMKYARNHGLPMFWVVEDNGISVCTDTESAWAGRTQWGHPVRRYTYELGYPHAGAGVRVQF